MTHRQVETITATMVAPEIMLAVATVPMSGRVRMTGWPFRSAFQSSSSSSTAHWLLYPPYASHDPCRVNDVCVR